MKKITTKDKVLNILNENKGRFYSGQELADKLSVSRTAVWKAINSLRAEGYMIDGSTNLGYALSVDTDVLSEELILELLSDKAKAFFDVECVEIIDSTNIEARKRGLEGEKEGLCIIAKEQTAGRGRKGRSFYSPGGSGLYLSILLRPHLKIEDAVLITTASAVAGAKACERVNDELSDGDVKIKWVNDLYLNGRKISGILTEASLSLETNGFDFAVMGIGFNLSMPIGGWPLDIKNRAGALFDGNYPSGTRNKLSAYFLEEFLLIYNRLPEVSYLNEYRERSIAIGQEVSVISGNGESRRAFVEDVNDKCELIVRFEGESIASVVNSGEISIKMD